MKPITPTYFASAAEFRTWLAAHATSETQLLVGFWRVATQRPCMTWSESVDEALCFGWIDGVRKRIDEQSYQIRFTPRKKTSIWSAVNIEKYERLCEAHRMTDAGRQAHAFRTEAKSVVYAYEQLREAALTAAEIREFNVEASAWRYFECCPPGYRKVLLHWISGAKKPETRASRLRTLIEACTMGRRLR